MSDKDRDKDSSGDDPLNNLFGMLFSLGGAQGGAQGQFPAGGIPIDGNMLSSFLGQIQGLMGQSGSASDVARQTAVSKVPTPDPSVTDEVARAPTTLSVWRNYGLNASPSSPRQTSRKV